MDVRGLLYLYLALLLAALNHCAAAEEDLLGNGASPQGVQEVLDGKRVVANAAWWGFDVEDATACLQAAIDSRARHVIVPYVGADWVVRPIQLAGNQEILFEPGVVVRAKEGEFKGTGDSLFEAREKDDIALRGYGAMLRMRKQDYMSPAYKKGEWRMALRFVGCRRVDVLGLRLESSGGDGIYLGSAGGDRAGCDDVVIRDVVCNDNYRQGISVISAANLLIENCVLSNTGGTPPAAGIDLEPNHAEEKLVNCVIRNCVMSGNEGAGMLVYLRQLSKQTPPVSILFENCYVQSGTDVGAAVGAVKDDGPGGAIEFRNCTIENTQEGGAYVYDKSADNARVRFVNCRWRNIGTAKRGEQEQAVPLLTTLHRPQLVQKHGGIDFVQCYVYDTVDRPVLVAEDEGSGLGVHDLKGEIHVQNPHGARMELPEVKTGVELRVLTTEPPG